MLGKSPAVALFSCKKWQKIFGEIEASMVKYLQKFLLFN